MIFTFLFSLAVLALGAIVYVLQIRKHRNFPPGPFPLPLIGNLHQIGMQPHKTLKAMRKRYGDVYTVHMGRFRCIVLNDTESIREAFSSPAFAGRPELNTHMDRSAGFQRGLFLFSGRARAEQRRFAIRTLREFGHGKASSEKMIQEEISELIDLFTTKLGQPLLIKNLFYAPMLKNVLQITTGKIFEHNNPHFQKVMHILTDCCRAVSMAGNIGGTISFFPTISTLFPHMSGYNKMMKAFQALSEIVSTIIKERKSLPQRGKPRNFVDAYMQNISREQDPHSSFFGQVGESFLIFALEDLLVGGAGTTSTALSWAFFLLSHNQEHQDKLFAEIQLVVGLARIPELSDRKKMPYTQAIIMEVLRISPVFPIAVPHSVTQDVQFRGYLIPKGTLAFANIYAASRDEGVWKEPDSFRPDRFILPGGVLDTSHNESLLAFSTGKRRCLGESLATDALFLFITTIFQKFKVSFDPARQAPAMHHTSVGALNSPKEFYVVLVER